MWLGRAGPPQKGRSSGPEAAPPGPVLWEPLTSHRGRATWEGGQGTSTEPAHGCPTLATHTCPREPLEASTSPRPSTSLPGQGTQRPSLWSQPRADQTAAHWLPGTGFVSSTTCKPDPHHGAVRRGFVRRLVRAEVPVSRPLCQGGQPCPGVCSPNALHGLLTPTSSLAALTLFTRLPMCSQLTNWDRFDNFTNKESLNSL